MQISACGTLYRALGRPEKMGLVTSRREDPDVPARENRPGRRLYTLTALVEAAAEEAARAPRALPHKRPRRRLAPA